MKKLSSLFLAAFASACFAQNADQAKAPFSAFQALVHDAKTRIKEMSVDQHGRTSSVSSTPALSFWRIWNEILSTAIVVP